MVKMFLLSLVSLNRAIQLRSISDNIMEDPTLQTLISSDPFSEKSLDYPATMNCFMKIARRVEEDKLKPICGRLEQTWSVRGRCHVDTAKLYL